MVILDAERDTNIFQKDKKNPKLNFLSHFIIPNFATTREKKEIIEEIFSTHIY